MHICCHMLAHQRGPSRDFLLNSHSSCSACHIQDNTLQAILAATEHVHNGGGSSCTCSVITCKRSEMLLLMLLSGRALNRSSMALHAWYIVQPAQLVTCHLLPCWHLQCKRARRFLFVVSSDSHLYEGISWRRAMQSFLPPLDTMTWYSLGCAYRTCTTSPYTCDRGMEARSTAAINTQLLRLPQTFLSKGRRHA